MMRRTSTAKGNAAASYWPRRPALAGRVVELGRTVIQAMRGQRAIIANTSSIVGTTAITSALGAVYWFAAARLFTPAEVGLAAALVSAMMLLATISVLGFGTLLTGELARQAGKAGALISAALLITSIVSMLAGGAFAVFAPALSDQFADLAAHSGLGLLFALGVSLTTAGIILDQAMIGLLRGGFQLGRNILFGVVKLAVLPATALYVAEPREMGIYGGWVLAAAVSFVALAAYARLTGIRVSPSRPRWQLLRGLGQAALGHHCLNLALSAPSSLLPLMVTWLLSAEVNAAFYIAFMMAGLVYVGPRALTTVLYAVGAGAPGQLRERLRFTLRLAAIGGFGSVLVLWIAADLVLQVFGKSYADEAAWTLRILALGVFPLIIREHYVALRRIHGEITSAVVIVGSCEALSLVLAAVGATYGLSGLSLGWLIGLMIEASLMTRLVYRAARMPTVRAEHTTA